MVIRVTLGYRDVEDLLAERGFEVSCEAVRRWICRFGPLYARALRRRRAHPTGPWHLDEMVALTGGERHWHRRSVDREGEVLDVLVRHRRGTGAALRVRGKRTNSRAEVSHQPTRRRERKQRRVRSIGPAQRFLPIHAAVHNTVSVISAADEHTAFSGSRR